MSGRVNRLCIKRDCTEWYAIFLIETESTQPQNVENVSENRIRGCDLGLEKFIVLDEGSNSKYEYPRFLQRSELKIKRLQKHLSTKRNGSRSSREIAFRLARLHLHVKRQREDYQNKLVSTILNKDTDVLVLEKLSVESMLKNHNLAKSLNDASFGSFAVKCIKKAKLLGKHILFVDPWGTSQFCHNCMEWVPKDLSERKHNCPTCKIEISRDLNSAKLIRRLGIQGSPPSDGGSSPAELLPLPSFRGMVNKSEAGSQHLDVGGRHKKRLRQLGEKVLACDFVHHPELFRTPVVATHANTD